MIRKLGILCVVVAGLLLTSCAQASMDGEVPVNRAEETSAAVTYASDEDKVVLTAAPVTSGELVETTTTTVVTSPELEVEAPGLDAADFVDGSPGATEVAEDYDETQGQLESSAASESSTVGSYKLVNMLDALEEQRSVSFKLASDNSYTLNYDKHEIPIHVELDADVQYIPNNGETYLDGQFTLVTSGQKQVTPIRSYILTNEGTDSYSRYVLTADSGWARSHIFDQQQVFFHPNTLAHYREASFALLGEYNLASMVSNIYRFELRPDFLMPLLAPINTGDTLPLGQEARVELNADTGLPMAISIDLKAFVGQMIVDHYTSEQSPVSLEVHDGQTSLREFRYNETSSLKLPAAVEQLKKGEGMELTEYGVHPSTHARVTEPSELPAEPGSEPLGPVSLAAPEPISSAVWQSLGKPLISEGGENTLVDLEKLVEGIHLVVENQATQTGGTSYVPQVSNHSDYIVEYLTASYRFGTEELKIQTDVAAILPGRTAPAMTMEGGVITRAMVQDHRIRRSGLQSLVAYLIDRDENIVMLSVNLKEDGSMSYHVAGGALRMETPEFDYRTLLPHQVRQSTQVKDQYYATVTNSSDRPFSTYHLLLRNDYQGTEFKLNVPDGFAADSERTDLIIQGGPSRSALDYSPLALSFQAGSQYYHYDYVLGRLIGTNY